MVLSEKLLTPLPGVAGLPFQLNTAALVVLYRDVALAVMLANFDVRSSSSEPRADPVFNTSVGTAAMLSPRSKAETGTWEPVLPAA